MIELNLTTDEAKSLLALMRNETKQMQVIMRKNPDMKFLFSGRTKTNGAISGKITRAINKKNKEALQNGKD